MIFYPHRNKNGKRIKGNIKIGKNVAGLKKCKIDGSGDIIIGNHVIFSEKTLIYTHSHYMNKNDTIKNQTQTKGVKISSLIIEDDVFIGPSVVFTNVKMPKSRINQSNNFQKTLIKKGVSIGANSTIICGNEIGENAFIGAGSLVTKNVPANKLAFGSPLKIIKNI